MHFRLPGGRAFNRLNNHFGFGSVQAEQRASRRSVVQRTDIVHSSGAKSGSDERHNSAEMGENLSDVVALATERR